MQLVRNINGNPEVRYVSITTHRCIVYIYTSASCELEYFICCFVYDLLLRIYRCGCLILK
ncbi:hypothetical protein HanPI659440_Chr05g0193831 [Helianthus annuus]|nr:hypothetical protein HanLR1_Chr05g0172941 [Helianthus annuus]KAJ0788615.1 hypothetical protein HanPI659440_Chr05g0193831 [Helianthus annuus]